MFLTSETRVNNRGNQVPITAGVRCDVAAVRPLDRGRTLTGGAALKFCVNVCVGEDQSRASILTGS